MVSFDVIGGIVVKCYSRCTVVKGLCLAFWDQRVGCTWVMIILFSRRFWYSKVRLRSHKNVTRIVMAAEAWIRARMKTTNSLQRPIFFTEMQSVIMLSARTVAVHTTFFVLSFANDFR